MFNKCAGTLFSTLPGREPAPDEHVLAYPHARNDCGLCREMDADFEIMEEALDTTTPGGRLIFHIVPTDMFSTERPSG